MQETGSSPWIGKIPWRKEWLAHSSLCLENPIATHLYVIRNLLTLLSLGPCRII